MTSVRDRRNAEFWEAKLAIQNPLSEEAAAHLIGITQSALRSRRVHGTGPRYHAIPHPAGRRTVYYYAQADVLAWMRDNTLGPVAGRQLVVPADCGTEAGYRRHRLKGTATCQPCRDAWAAAQRRRLAQRDTA